MQTDIAGYVEALAKVYAFIQLKISYGTGNLERFIFSASSFMALIVCCLFFFKAA